MKRIISLLLVIIWALSLCITGLTACVWDNPNQSDPSNTSATTTDTTTKPIDNSTDDPTDDPNYDPNNPEEFHLVRKMIMNKEKHLLVFNKTENLSFEELVLAQAIQGIYARTSARYYSWSSGSYDLWLQDMVDNYGYTYECVTLEQMVKAYIQDYGKKYVLYDRAALAETTNSACAIAGVTGYLPVDVKIRDKAESWGLEIQIDASKMTERTCFDIYKDKFNTDGIVQQDPNNINLRDWAVACKYFVFFRKGETSENMAFREEVHNWLDDDSAIFGWCPNDEVRDVRFSSQHGQFTFPSDHSKNTTIFACADAFGKLDFTQNAKETGVKAEQGKHYVCIMMSDGDNVQMWYNRDSFIDRSTYFGAERDNSFPMGWSVQPGLLDLGPIVLNCLKNEAGPKDYFVASVSGLGYINPQVYPTLDTYLESLGKYLAATDLSVVQILDSGADQRVIEAYARVPELKGGIYCYGDRYAGGNGSVFWSNDKPFVSIRETLWNANVEAMAKRINGYAKDPTTIEGYTAINLHPWSMTYQDVVKLVSLLDENVVVVTADDFIRLITENVPHKNAIMLK
jgi:hypothetical protein